MLSLVITTYVLWRFYSDWLVINISIVVSSDWYWVFVQNLFTFNLRFLFAGIGFCRFSFFMYFKFSFINFFGFCFFMHFRFSFFNYFGFNFFWLFRFNFLNYFGFCCFMYFMFRFLNYFRFSFFRYFNFSFLNYFRFWFNYYFRYIRFGILGINFFNYCGWYLLLIFYNNLFWPIVFDSNPIVI